MRFKKSKFNNNERKYIAERQKTLEIVQKKF